jgi:hypothetical protein
MYTENSDAYIGFGGLGNRQADFDLLPLERSLCIWNRP